MVSTLLATLALVGTTQNPSAGRINTIKEALAYRLALQTDIWFDDGDYPRVIQLLRMQAQMEPKDYEVVSNLGFLLESTDANDEALATYVWYKKLNPGTADGPYLEADFYFRKKAYIKVPPLLEPSLVYRPHANSYRELAHSYERLNLLADSKRVWNAYLATNPNDGTAKRNLERVLKKLGS